MSINHQLNPIYQPGALVPLHIQLEAYARNPPVERHSKHHECAAKLSDKQLAHNIRIRQINLDRVAKATEEKYREGFAGKSATVNDLCEKWEHKFTAGGIAIQLRKYAKLGKTQKIGIIPGTKRDIWEWIN